MFSVKSLEFIDILSIHSGNKLNLFPYCSSEKVELNFFKTSNIVFCLLSHHYAGLCPSPINFIKGAGGTHLHFLVFQ